MGISNVMVHWFERLNDKRAFAGKRSILDLGPQDMVSTVAVLGNFVASVERRAFSEAQVADEFRLADASGLTATKRFYAALGMTEYSSVDLGDKRADYTCNLNEPMKLGRQFDVITNFGTLEHIFNVANLLTSMHEHLRTGGLFLHVLPTRGDYNHGFYNIHSVWYRDLAAANDYEIVDLVCVPDFGGQHVVVNARERFGDKPPRRSTFVDIAAAEDDAGDERFARTVALRLLLRRFWPGIEPRIYDYIFAALRKKTDKAFVFPQQGFYAVKA
jgi:SAM-dependent methyltransferase